MKISTALRKNSFWLADKLRGGFIGYHYNDIKQILEDNDSSTSANIRGQYLDRILNHALRTTPYYRNIQNVNILEFPVINKNIIRDNYTAFRSEDNRYSVWANLMTSGSTGTPFAIDHDKRKRERNTADAIYFGELAGYTLGQRLYYFKIWNEFTKKSRLSSFSQNIVPYDVRNLSENFMADIIKILKKDKSEKVLLGYSSVYDTICKFLSSTNSDPINCNIKGIIAMAEAISLSTKEMMLKYFGINPVSRYSNIENGIIAQQMKDGSSEFMINNASYYVEVLQMNSDKPAKYGTPGRIVVTDLFNYCMPLIRYDTGDIGIMTHKNVYGNQLPVFKIIEGRRMDMIFDTSGSLVSSFVITNNMWKYKEIKQYQFIQTSRNSYIFKLNADLPFKRADDLLEEFKGYFGNDANISLEYVHEIPLLQSGKRKKVLNTFMNS